MKTGYKHSAETKQKISDANRRFYAMHPEKAIARGAKIRGENNYHWKGGVSQFNQSIRRLTENRKWMDAVKARDGKCVRCGNHENLESHHAPPLAELIKRLRIMSVDDARARASELWNVRDGITLCAKCHYDEHGRIGTTTLPRITHSRNCIECGKQFIIVESRLRNGGGKFCDRICHGLWRRKHQTGKSNGHWKGGKVTIQCRKCKTDVLIKPCKINPAGNYCSMECRYAH